MKGDTPAYKHPEMKILLMKRVITTASDAE